MFTIEWRLALVVSLLIPLFILVVMSRRRKLGEVSRQVKAKVAVITTEIESSLSGIRTAKAFANEDVEFSKFCEANDRFRTSKRQFHKEMGIFNAVMEFFLSIMSVAVIAVGGYLIMRSQMNYIDLIIFSLYISTFISPIRKLANFTEQFAVGVAGLQRFTQAHAHGAHPAGSPRHQDPRQCARRHRGRSRGLLLYRRTGRSPRCESPCDARRNHRHCRPPAAAKPPSAS